MIWNRTSEKAEKLAEEFEVHAIESLDGVSDTSIFDIVINTTSVGMEEQKSVLPEDFWQPTHTAFDIVYSPLETKFLSDAEEAGAQIVTGDHMLVHQALEQFRIWHGVELEPEVMFEAFFGED